MTKRPSLKSVATSAAPPERSAKGPSPVAPHPQVVRPQPSRVGKKVVSVYLTESVWRDLKLLAVKTDSTIDALVRQGIDRIFAEHGVNRGAVEE
jgi:hypothetical protein